jgi:regulator of replication initiation timing
MKKILFLIFISYSIQSVAFMDFLFKKEVPNPMEITTFEARLSWLLANDDDFKSYYKEMQEEQAKKDLENKKVLDDLEKERLEAENTNPEEIYRKKIIEKQKQQDEINAKQRKIEAEVLKKWIYIEGKFVNIEEEKRKKEQEKKDYEETERVRKFQMEEGLKLAPKGKKFLFFE